MSNLEIIDSNYNEVRVNPKYMKSNCDTTPNCYDVQYHGYEGIVFAQAFLYGGPGGQCGIWLYQQLYLIKFCSLSIKIPETLYD